MTAFVGGEANWFTSEMIGKEFRHQIISNWNYTTLADKLITAFVIKTVDQILGLHQTMPQGRILIGVDIH